MKQPVIKCRCEAADYAGVKDRWERYRKILTEFMMSDVTLESVGEHYGISRERVRQIVDIALPQARRIKKDLMYVSPKFRCIICGGLIRTEQRWGYRKIPVCSTSCRKFYVKFDIRSEKQCQHCSKGFYPYRHWKHTQNNSTFCSMQCYTEFSRKKGRWSNRQGKYVKGGGHYRIECSGCKKEFTAKYRNRKYHNLVCYRKNGLNVRKKR